MERKSFKVNVVDIIITVVIAAVIAVGAFMIANAFGVDASADKQNITVEYVLQFKGLRPEFSDKVQVGDTIVDAQKRHKFGNVSNVRYYKYTLDVFNRETGEMQIAEHPDYVTLEITIVASGYISDGMYYLTDSARKISVGTGMSIHAPNFCGTGYVSDLRISR